MTNKITQTAEQRAKDLSDKFDCYLEDILGDKLPRGSSWKFFLPWAQLEQSETAPTVSLTKAALDLIEHTRMPADSSDTSSQESIWVRRLAAALDAPTVTVADIAHMVEVECINLTAELTAQRIRAKFSDVSQPGDSKDG